MKEEESEPIVTDVGVSKIIDEKTQLAIRIPAELKDTFRIDPKYDGIGWIIIQTGNKIWLQADLIKDYYKNEEKN